MATSGAFLEETYEKAVEAEVTKRSVTLTNLERNTRQYQKEIATYDELKARIQNLQTTSRNLYGFRSPFRQFQGVGEGIPEYFSITADRTTANTKHTIEVKQIAQSQKFYSRAYAMTESLPATELTLRIGTNEKTVSFSGGTLLSFQQALSKTFGKDMKVSITQKSRNMQIITLDMVSTGANNIVEVIQDTGGLTKELNLFTRRNYRYLGHIFNETLLSKWKDESDNISTNYFVKKDMLVLKGNNKLSMPLDREAEGNKGIRISFTSRLATKDEVVEEAPLLPPTVNFSIPDTGALFDKIDSIKFKDVELYGEGLSPAENNRTLEEIKKYNEALERERLAKTNETPKAPEPVAKDTGFSTDFIGLKYIDASGVEREKFFATPTLTTSWQRLELPVGSDFSEKDIILDVILLNKNDNYDVYFKDIIIDTTEKEEDYPNFLITDAKDARLSLNGVDVLSPNNEFSKVIDGVTIAAKKVTPEAYDVSIEINKEDVINAIVNFVRAYNELVDFLNDTTKTPLTRDNQDALANMSRTEMIDLATTIDIHISEDMSDEYLRKKLSYVGVLNGNNVANTVSQRIRGIVAGAYPTRYGGELALLEQIGVARGLEGDSWGTIRKGFLQIDEKKFLEKLDLYIDGIEELFANTDGKSDVPNTGVAIAMNDFVTPYIQVRGIIENSTTMAKAKLKSNQEQTVKERERVAAFRDERTAAYYKMQTDMKNSEKQMKQLEAMQRAQMGNN